jgi:SAM-dependent methyltransferase
MSDAELEGFLQGLYPWTYSAGVSLTQNYDFSSHRSVVDVGGGSGALAIALTEAVPRLQATVVDLPAVAAITRRFVERAGAGERIRVQAVDVVREPLAGAFDAVVLKAFLQVVSLAEAAQALAHIHQALKPGGPIYILDYPLDDSRLTPPESVLFGPVFSTIYEDGQKRTVQEYKDLLRETGFEDFELDSNRIIRARKRRP